MWIMNNFGIRLLQKYYPAFVTALTPEAFARLCWVALNEIPAFSKVVAYADRLYDPETEMLDVYEIDGVYAYNYVDMFIRKHGRLLKIKLERMLSEHKRVA